MGAPGSPSGLPNCLAKTGIAIACLVVRSHALGARSHAVGDRRSHAAGVRGQNLILVARSVESHEIWNYS